VLTSYLIANAIILPLSGWLTNSLPQALLHDCVSSLPSVRCSAGLPPACRCCSLPHSAGLGGGGLQPSAQAILADTFPPRQRAWHFPSTHGGGICAGNRSDSWGWITDSYSWRWLFYINVPVASSPATVSRLIHNPPALAGKRLTARTFLHGLDGHGLLALGLGSLEFVLDKGRKTTGLARENSIPRRRRRHLPDRRGHPRTCDQESGGRSQTLPGAQFFALERSYLLSRIRTGR